MDTSPIYREVQHFRQPWVWALILIGSITLVYGAVQQLVLGKPWGNHPSSDAGLLVLLVVFGFGMPYLFYLTRLITEVRTDGVYIRYFPIHRSFRRFAFSEIRSFEAVTYRPIHDYGGWGIRYGKSGKVYNVSGNRGVRLELTDRHRLLIGSQKPELLAEAIGSAAGRRKPL